VLYASPPPQDETPPQAPNKKMKKSFTINPNLSASISSNGILTDSRKDRPPVASSSLGVPSKKKPPKTTTSNNKSMSKKDRQRTGNGAVDSSRQTFIANPESEDIQVLEAKRNSKTVTIVRGMTSPMKDRSLLLKKMKQSLGVGGTLVDGVLEIQGSHATKVVATLKENGYNKAKRIGK
jgi:translation initiation factor 1 (eIF-1/SUI1)